MVNEHMTYSVSGSVYTSINTFNQAFGKEEFQNVLEDDHFEIEAMQNCIDKFKSRFMVNFPQSERTNESNSSRTLKMCIIQFSAVELLGRCIREEESH